MKNKSTRVLSLILAFLLVLSCVPTYALDYSIKDATGTNTITLEGEALQKWLEEIQGAKEDENKEEGGLLSKAFGFFKDFVLPDNADAAVTQYSIGNDVVGYFDDETGVFTVSGTGAMSDYIITASRPYNSITSDVTELVIEPGITLLGRSVFSGFVNITSVTIPATVDTINQYAFNGCANLREITNEVSESGTYVVKVTNNKGESTIKEIVIEIPAESGIETPEKFESESFEEFKDEETETLGNRTPKNIGNKTAEDLKDVITEDLEDETVEVEGFEDEMTKNSEGEDTEEIIVE